MKLTQEEIEAISAEFSALIRRKHQIGAENMKAVWLPKHEKHLSGIAQMIVKYERDTGDYHSFLRLKATAKEGKPSAPQLQLL